MITDCVALIKNNAAAISFVITTVHSLKRDALACHRSQKNWLDLTQGTDSYLHALDAESKTLGKHSGAFIHAEGWSRHLHLGFADATANPLKDALGKAFRFAPQPSV